MIRRVVYIPELPSANTEGFDWPTLEAVRHGQDEHEASQSPNLSLVELLYRFDDGATWIPDQADNLQLRICVIAHTFQVDTKCATIPKRKSVPPSNGTRLPVSVLRICLHRFSIDYCGGEGPLTVPTCGSRNPVQQLGSARLNQRGTWRQRQ